MVTDGPTGAPLGATAIGAGNRGSRWRKVRRSAWFRRGKLLLKRVAGREPWLGLDLHANLARNGDWAYRPDGLQAGDLVYALGVGADLGFELELITGFGVEVHAFDPSPESRRWVAAQSLPPALHYHDLAVGDRDGVMRLQARASERRGASVMYSAVDDSRSGAVVEVQSACLDTITQRLGHARIALLKMDIEGAEFGALRSMLGGRLRPAQLLVEFHHRFPGVGKAETVATVAALRAERYRLAYISATGREFTFLRAV